jgi:hypothetical protein
MNHAELVALLSEARESLRAYADKDQVQELESWHGNRWSKAQDALARIDAALAAHRDEVPAQDSAKDVVESEVEWNNHNVQFSTAYPDDETSLTVCRFDLTQQQWRWDMNREVKKRGYCATEAEAKSAAIKAARWLR